MVTTDVVRRVDVLDCARLRDFSVNVRESERLWTLRLPGVAPITATARRVRNIPFESPFSIQGVSTIEYEVGLGRYALT